MEHVYLVCYDISDQKRWRKIYKTMKGYGAWLQLSVFQCRLNKEDLLKMTDILTEIMHCDEDNLIIIDIGAAENVSLKVASYGRPFQPIKQGAVVI
jgi:CRISPR-associated protein Cas2